MGADPAGRGARDGEIHALAGMMSDREAARRLGVDHKTVGRVRRAAGIDVYRRPLAEHGTGRRWRQGCRCGACVEARSVVKAAQYRARPKATEAAFPLATSERLTALHREDQERTRQDASAAREPWTEQDLAIAADYGLSAVQVAQQLGRSLAAVRHARARYRLRETWDQASGGVEARGRRAKRRV